MKEHHVFPWWAGYLLISPLRKFTIDPRELLGGYESARRVHFLAMAAMVAFVAVHLLMVALVPRTLLAMIRGR